ncbi:hypothetical protein NLO74_23010 [Pseudomonas tremae]|nr:hypothetical protein [Pseudomonas tremae]MCQ2992081.1 hypothetical protein [Pseudomonas tremae]MCQ3028863.1 hypothetical protein [Pseudomonas tremae]
MPVVPERRQPDVFKCRAAWLALSGQETVLPPITGYIDVVISAAGFADLNLQLAPQFLLIKHIHITRASQYRRAEIVYGSGARQRHKRQHRHYLVELRIGLSWRDLRFVQQRQTNRLAIDGRNLQVKVRAVDVIPDFQDAAVMHVIQFFRSGLINTIIFRADQQNLLPV